MLYVSLLGEQAVTNRATGAVLTRSPRTLALVAFLAVHAGLPQPRQRIAELFWPDSTTAQALTNLRRELHHLRQALGTEPCLVVTSRDLCWQDSPGISVDVRVFALEREATEAALAAADLPGVLAHGAAAVAQYRGEFLPGGYDDWVLTVRAELERRCVELYDLLRDARSRTGDLGGAMDAARRRIALQPLEETGYRELMVLQAEAGDRAGAVRTYHQCASILDRELGIAPAPATRSVVGRLLSEPPPEPRPRRDRPAGLVGRARELARLVDLWRTATDGHPSVAVVVGDAGVGKTRLVTELEGVARRDGIVAVARCFGASGRLALAPVAEWLRVPAVQAAAARLDPVWRAEVDRLAPSGAGDSSRAMAEAWQRHRFFEGMARALLAVDRPLLLVLDNMQWCDQETLAFLSFCLGLASSAPIMVAGTLRAHEYDSDVAAWTGHLRSGDLLTELPLGPLDPADTARLAATVAGRPLRDDDVTLLHATTGGYPLYVVEAVRTAVETGNRRPPVGDLTAVLRGRIEHTGAAARDIAGLAAAVGRDFSLDLLVEASGQDPDTVVHAVDELWRRGIVREQPDGYDFSHDLLRDAAYAQVSPPQRWLLHRQVAKGLERLHATDTTAVSAQLAEQYAKGGRPELAVSYYRRAADVASGTLAHAEAIRLHSAALSVVRRQPDDTRRQAMELAILERMAAPLNARYGYSSPRVRQVLERSVELAEALGNTESTLTGLVGLWASRFVQGDMAGAYRTVSRALALVEPDSELSGSAHFAFAGTALSRGRLTEASRHFELTATLTTGAQWWSVGTRPDLHGLAWSAHAHWLAGDVSAARTACRDAVRLARAIDPYNLAVALAYAAITHHMCGDLTELRAAVDELGGLCARHDFAYYPEWGTIVGAWSEPDGSGEERARQGIANLTAAGSFARMPYWLSLLADIQSRGGRPAAARATLDAGIVAARARGDVWWLPELLRQRARHDDEPRMVQRLRSAVRLAEEQGSTALRERSERDLDELTVRPGH